MLTRSLHWIGFLLVFPCNLRAAVLHEQLSSIPNGWAALSEPDENTIIHLEVSLAPSNTDRLIEELYAVSTPGHARYGHHWSKEQVDALVAPTAEAEEATISWLNSAGVENIASDGSYVKFSTTVGTANKLLVTSFKYYDQDGNTKLRTTEYSVSEDVAKHVALIHPTTFFGRLQAHVPTSFNDKNSLMKRTSTNISETPTKHQVAESCETSITPKCIKQLYNISANYTAAKHTGASIGFGSFLNQTAIYSDLFLFEEHFGVPQQNITKLLLNGGTDHQDFGPYGEANLDVQTIIGVAHPIEVVEIVTGGSPPFIPNLDEPVKNTNEPYLPYYQELLSMDNKDLPQVITNSYGDDEQTVPLAYATTVCNLIAQMGLRGITVLYSSGDTGVGAPCQSNEGKRTAQFTPQFPATCPYVTAVGGTQAIPEIAWLGSGGGFSNHFPRPPYQDRAVGTYLNTSIEPSTRQYLSQYANFSGRGFPDVAAHSLHPNFQIFNNGKPTPSGGTSASAPVWAGIIGLLNSARYQHGLSSLGWLNPWLYGAGIRGQYGEQNEHNESSNGGNIAGYHYLTDVTAGKSVGCTGMNTQHGRRLPEASVIEYAAWNATIGWDPVTGWGVPDFGALLEAVLTKG